jgi:hypothetical protein
MAVVFETEIAGFPVKLHHDRAVRAPYAVTYGQQYNCSLDYPQAALELGRCIMHALQCEGKLDRNGP